MKNYLSKRNEGNNLDFGFWSDPFGDFFKPLFYGERNDLMKTDIKETDTSFELSVDLPGFDKKDISLALNNGYLTIEAKREENEEGKKNYLRRERSMSCSRSYYVGDKVTEKEIKAKYNNGTLIIDIPKVEEKEIQSSRIEIE